MRWDVYIKWSYNPGERHLYLRTDSVAQAIAGIERYTKYLAREYSGNLPRCIFNVRSVTDGWRRDDGKQN